MVYVSIWDGGKEIGKTHLQRLPIVGERLQIGQESRKVNQVNENVYFEGQDVANLPTHTIHLLAKVFEK